MNRDEARRALVARARRELPEPGDPRALGADLARLCGQGADGADALGVATRAGTAWVQLRDLRLERGWQAGLGWHLGRNLVLFAALALLAVVALNPPPGTVEPALYGAAGYFLLVLALLPLRLRRQARAREAILRAYGEDLDAFLGGLRDGA